MGRLQGAGVGNVKTKKRKPFPGEVLLHGGKGEEEFYVTWGRGRCESYGGERITLRMWEVDHAGIFREVVARDHIARAVATALRKAKRT